MNILSKLAAKGRIAAVLALGFTTLFSACKEEDPPAVNLDKPFMRINMAEQVQNLRVISNTDWSATINYGTAGQSDWITMSRETGKGTMDLTLYIEECNTELMDGRQATITFTTGGNPVDRATLVVNQSHNEAILEVEPSDIEVGAAATTVHFMVQSNTQWEIIGVCDWARVTNITADASGKLKGEGNKLVRVEVDEYLNNGYDRSFGFIVSTSNAVSRIDRVFTLTQRDQDDPTLILGQEMLYFEAIVDATNNTLIVPVVTNTSEAPVVASNTSWCTAIYEAGTKTIKVTVTSNTESDQYRECVVTVLAYVDNTAVTKQIRVVQAGSKSPQIVISRPVITIPAIDPADPDHKNRFSVGFYTIPANLTVSLAGDQAAWLTATLVGNAVNVVAEPNPTNEARQIALLLYATSAGQTVSGTITVTQNAVGDMNLSVSPAVINADQPGASIEFFVFADIPGVNVDAVAGATWITGVTATAQTIPGYAGTTYKVTATVASNDAADARQTIITVRGASGQQTGMQTVTVNQAGTGSPQAVLVRNTITVPKAADSYSVAIANTDGTTINCSMSAAWLSNAAFNSANGTIDFDVDLNDVSAANRTGFISIQVVKGGKTQLLELEVIQLGTGAASLIISEQDVVVEADQTDVTVNVVPENDSTWDVLGYSPVALFSTAPAKAGDTLEFTVGENTTTEPRNGKITLIATNGDSQVVYTITVTQKGVAGPDIMPMATTIYVGQEATTAGSEPKILLLNWSSSIALNVSAVANSAMFAADTKIVNDNELQIAVTENLSPDQRTGKVTLTATRGGKTQMIEITVIQAGIGTPDLTIGSTSFVFGPAAQTDVNLYFVNENESVVTVLSYPSWITEAAGTDLTAGVWAFDVAANTTNAERRGEIVLKAVKGNKTALYTVPAVQHGLASLGASLTTSSILVPQDGTITDIIKAINVPDPIDAVNVYSSQTWLTLGGGATETALTAPSYTLIPEATANASHQARTANILFELRRGDEVQFLNVSVLQNGVPTSSDHTIILSHNAVNFLATDDAIAGEATVTVLNYDSALAYTLHQDGSWFTVDPATLIGNTFTITPSANTGAARTGSVVVALTDADGNVVKEVITLTQAGAGDVSLTLDQLSVDFDAADTAPQTVTILDYDASLEYFIIRNSGSWFTVPSTATTDAFDVTPTANSGAARTGQIEVQARRNGAVVASKLVSVTQTGVAAPTLNLDQQGLTFAADGTPATATVNILGYSSTSGVDYTVANDSAWWLTADDTTPGSVVISALENTGATRTGLITVTAGANGEFATKTITVVQYGADALDLILAGYAVNFETTPPATLPHTIDIVNSDPAVVAYSVHSSDQWLVAAIDDSGAPVKVALTPEANTGIPRSATVTVTATLNGVSVQKDIAVTQAGVILTPIYPIIYSVTFPANSTDPALIDIINFDSALHNFAFSTAGANWIVVTPPSSPMQIAPNSVWTDASPRMGTAGVVITDKATGAVLSRFEITVVQEGVRTPNITYAPQTHYNVPLSGTASPLITTFVNPGALALEVVSGTSSDGITNTVWDNDNLRIHVGANPTLSPRTLTVVVAAKDAANTTVALYPITIQQNGTGTVNPAVHAWFVGGNTMYVDQNTIPTTVTVAVESEPSLSVEITSVTLASGAPAWLTNTQFVSVDSFTFTIDPSLFGSTATETGHIAVVFDYTDDNGNPAQFSLTYNVTHLLEYLNARLVATHGSIAANVVSDVITFSDLDGASVATIQVLDVAGGGSVTWITGYDDSALPDITLDVEENPDTTPRTAEVRITMGRPGFANQVLSYFLTQEGLLPLGVVWPTSVTLAYNDLTLTLTPDDNPNNGGVTGTVDVTGVSPWASVNSVSGTYDDNIDLAIQQNPDTTPRSGHVKFTMSAGAGSGFADQECSVFVIQLPSVITQDLLTIGTIPALGYAVGSSASVPFTDLAPGGGTAVTVYTFDSGTLSSAVVSGTNVNVTARLINTTGSDRNCTFLLKAVNGTTTEWYEVTVPQASLTQAELIAATTMSNISITGGVFNSVTHGTPRTNVSVAASSPLLTVGNNGAIEINITLPGYVLGTPVETSDPNDVMREDRMNISGTRLNLWVRGHGITGPFSGTAVIKVPISVGSISADFIITIVVS